MGRWQLYTAFFLSEFGPDLLNGPHFVLDLFRYYLSFRPPDDFTVIKGCLSSSDPVVFSVHALAEARFGRINADSVSTQQSFNKYGMALRGMSTKLEELKYNDSEFKALTEDEWQHFAFFCIVMACWELEMFPTSRKWEKHVHGLAAAIALRGTEHAYSENNLKLLAGSRLFIILQTLSSREPSFLSSPAWRENSPTRSGSASKIKAIQHGPVDLDATSEYKIHDSLDILVEEAASTVAVTAQYDRLLGGISGAHSKNDEELCQVLVYLHAEANAILNRVETQLANWDTAIHEIPLAVWLSSHQSMRADSASTDEFFWSTSSAGLPLVVDTVLSFPSMREHHILTLFWTTAMSLRLLLSDMLALMLTMALQENHQDLRGESEQHRAILMSYAQKVVQTIGYGALRENRSVSPFFLATAFQMAIVTLERECDALKANDGNEYAVYRCENMRNLAAHYIEWAMQNKIPIKVDMRLPRQLAPKPTA